MDENFKTKLIFLENYYRNTRMSILMHLLINLEWQACIILYCHNHWNSMSLLENCRNFQRTVD